MVFELDKRKLDQYLTKEPSYFSEVSLECYQCEKEIKKGEKYFYDSVSEDVVFCSDECCDRYIEDCVDRLRDSLSREIMEKINND